MWTSGWLARFSQQLHVPWLVCRMLYVTSPHFHCIIVQVVISTKYFKLHRFKQPCPHTVLLNCALSPPRCSAWPSRKTWPSSGQPAAKVHLGTELRLRSCQHLANYRENEELRCRPDTIAASPRRSLHSKGSETTLLKVA